MYRKNYKNLVKNIKRLQWEYGVIIHSYNIFAYKSNTNVNVPKWSKMRLHLLCKPLYSFTLRDWGGRGGLCTAFLAVSLPVYEACFSLTVSGIKRANPSETSDESFKRNNERHTAWGCISGWTYSKLERTAAAHDKQQRKNITASLAATPTSLTINHIFCLQDINKYAAEQIRNLAQHEYLK